MTISILAEAWADMRAARDFYDDLEPGVGDYFAASLVAEIESLKFFAGVHPLDSGYFRALAKRFPFAIYYLVHSDVVQVHAVLDLRRDPAWIQDRLAGIPG